MLVLLFHSFSLCLWVYSLGDKSVYYCFSEISGGNKIRYMCCICGRLYSPKMTTTVSPAPYALLSMWHSFRLFPSLEPWWALDCSGGSTLCLLTVRYLRALGCLLVLCRDACPGNWAIAMWLWCSDQGGP